MKLKFGSPIAVAVLLSVAAFSQASNSSAGSALPSAPGTADPSAAAPALNPNAKMVAAINVERAIMLSNEGQRDMNALQKKFEPKLADLKAKGDELESLNKKLTSATSDTKDEISRQIEQKKKVYDREQQDIRDDAQGQQGEIGQRILQKMAPVMVKYAQDNGFGMIMDTSAPWPQGPVLWASPASLDITDAVVAAYNAQSGVPAPATPAARPSAGGTIKPTTPSAKPSTTAPAPK